MAELHRLNADGGAWSARDYSTILRAQALLAQHYGPLDIAHDVTDRGEPWAALIVTATQDVVAHFAVMDREAVVDLPDWGFSGQGYTVREALDRAMHACGLTADAAVTRRDNVVALFGRASQLAVAMAVLAWDWLSRSGKARADELESGDGEETSRRKLKEAVPQSSDQSQTNWRAVLPELRTSEAVIGLAQLLAFLTVTKAAAEDQTPRTGTVATIDLAAAPLRPAQDEASTLDTSANKDDAPTDRSADLAPPADSTGPVITAPTLPAPAQPKDSAQPIAAPTDGSMATTEATSATLQPTSAEAAALAELLGLPLSGPMEDTPLANGDRIDTAPIEMVIEDPASEMADATRRLTAKELRDTDSLYTTYDDADMVSDRVESSDGFILIFDPMANLKTGLVDALSSLISTGYGSESAIVTALRERLDVLNNRDDLDANDEAQDQVEDKINDLIKTSKQDSAKAASYEDDLSSDESNTQLTDWHAARDAQDLPYIAFVQQADDAAQTNRDTDRDEPLTKPEEGNAPLPGPVTIDSIVLPQTRETTPVETAAPTLPPTDNDVFAFAAEKPALSNQDEAADALRDYAIQEVARVALVEADPTWSPLGTWVQADAVPDSTAGRALAEALADASPDLYQPDAISGAFTARGDGGGDNSFGGWRDSFDFG